MPFDYACPRVASIRENPVKSGDRRLWGKFSPSGTDPDGAGHNPDDIADKNGVDYRESYHCCLRDSSSLRRVHGMSDVGQASASFHLR